MTNSQLADTLDLLADLLEFQGANSFRTRAYRNGSRTIRNMTESLATLVADSKDLTEIDGIGKSVAGKCQTLIETGSLPQLEELKEQIPQSVLAILRIPGLGPKKAAALYNELGISTLDQLKEACEAEKVRELKGFAAKTEKAILDGIQFAASAGQRIYWSKANELVEELREHMNSCKAIRQMEFAGSYRRGKESVGDLDILVDSKDANKVMDHLVEHSRVADIMVRGETKMSVRLDSELQVDLRVVPEESFGAALQYFTGSKEHNVVVRGRAKKMGLLVNEYGVYRSESDSGDGGLGESIAGATEKEVYEALELPWFPPELREARNEFEWAESGDLPDLIELADIRGDLHMHTTATDGKNSIREMVDAARKRKLKYIAITDHSQRVSMAFGLDPDRLRQQWKEVDEVNDDLGKSFTVLKGIECDILEAGGMDLPDDVLAEADWVLASIHYGQKQPMQQITDRILGAIENPYVTAIAHPTGRIINKRESYAVDLDQIFKAARKHGKLLELNANPARLDLNDIYCAAAKAHGIPIVINTDAHHTGGMDVMQFGILQARRAGLTAADVANTRTWPQMKKILPARVAT